MILRAKPFAMLFFMSDLFSFSLLKGIARKIVFLCIYDGHIVVPTTVPPLVPVYSPYLPVVQTVLIEIVT